MKFVWLSIAGVAIAVAAVLLSLGDFDTAFVVAAIGLVAWFLNYRMQLKDVTGEGEVEKERLEIEGSEDEKQS